MKPGEYLLEEGNITLNEERDTAAVLVSNTGDRPIQVGSHYHFIETNASLEFIDLESLKQYALDLPTEA